MKLSIIVIAVVQKGLSCPSLTVSEVLSRFVHCLLRKIQDFIYMPNHSSVQLTKEQFYLLGRFPGVIGAIDGTHIYSIIAPSEDEHLFVNRKGFHSINVQVSTT